MVPRNIFNNLSLTVFVWLIALSCSTSQAQYWEKGYALLTNDRIMSGRIEQQADLFKIKQNEGNEIRVPKNQVAVIASSMQELYQYKKKSLPPYPRTGDHIKLARWCLASNLLAEAGEHYLLLARVAPPADNPSIKLLGEEIRSKMLQQNDFRVAVGMAPLSSTVGTNAPAQKPTSKVVTASSTTAANSSMVSPRANMKFNETVQHILINRCGQAGCHGHATNTPFKLLEVGGADTASRTQANMDSVLRYISSDPQAKSALIEYMSRSHGPLHTPPISNRDAKLSFEVINWVQMIQSPVVSAEALNQPSVLNPLSPAAPQLRQVPHVPNMPSTSTGPKATQNQEFPQDLELPSQAELDSLDAQIGRPSQPQYQPLQPQQPQLQSQVKPASTGSNLPSNDLFDPAEFNRQAGTRK